MKDNIILVSPRECHEIVLENLEKFVSFWSMIGFDAIAKYSDYINNVYGKKE